MNASFAKKTSRISSVRPTMRKAEQRIEIDAAASVIKCVFICTLLFLITAYDSIAGEDSARPETIRVRAPIDRIGDFFRLGVETRGMAREDFEELLRAARRGLAERRGGSTPRLIRARHRARWDNGVLTGESELTIDHDSTTPGLLPLVPWNAAIVAPPDRPVESPPLVRTTPNGAIKLWIDRAGTNRVRLAWRLRAREGTGGRSFRLDLPQTEISSIVLDVPDWIEPEGPEGMRRGPESLGGSLAAAIATIPGRKTWRFDGPGGSIALRFHDAKSSAGRSSNSKIWVGGPTRVDVEQAWARWVADWTIDPGADGAKSFLIDLDPGLELVDVSGPALVAFQAESTRSDGGTRLRIRVSDEVAGPTPISVRAVARIPSGGFWSVPAARLVDAEWTNGKTIVRLAPGLSLVDYRERSGRRVPFRPEDAIGFPPTGLKIVFEPDGPRSVADLKIEPAQPDIVASVRGVVAFDSRSPRIKAEIRWHVNNRGSSFPVVELPRSWIVDRITKSGSSDALIWQSESAADGSTRVRFPTPPSVDDRGDLALTLTAISPSSGVSGPIALPRVKPAGARLIDEVWSAEVAPDLALKPIRARGFCRIDPAEAGVDVRVEPGRTFAWRWTSADAEARIDRIRIEAESTVRSLVVAAIDPDREHFDYHIAIQSHSTFNQPFTYWIDADEKSGRLIWRSADENGAAPIEARLVELGRREGPDSPRAGSTWEIDLPKTAAGETTLLHAVLERPRAAREAIPLIAPNSRFNVSGIILIKIDRSIRATARSDGLTRLDPELAWGSADRLTESFAIGVREFSELSGGSRTRKRRAFAFEQDRRFPRLELKTEALQENLTYGLIDRAESTTWTSPSDSPPRRITLSVLEDGDAPLRVELPEGSTPTSATLDGAPIAALGAGRGLLFNLGRSATKKNRRELTIDYRAAAPSSNLLFPFVEKIESIDFPRLSFPVTSTISRINAPRDMRIEPVDEATAIESSPKRRESPFDYFSGSRGRASQSSLSDTSEIDRIARSAFETSSRILLGDMLKKWDEGSAPIVVDRTALAELGLGPKSTISAPRSSRRSIAETGATRDAANAILAEARMIAIPIPGAILVTSKRSAYEIDLLGGRRRVVDAVGWGADSLDRYQSLARWLNEPTPAASTRDPASFADSIATNDIDESESYTIPVHSIPRFGGGAIWNQIRFKVVDETRETAIVVSIALAVFAAALFIREASSTQFAIGSTILVLIALLLGFVNSTLAQITAQGIVAGAIAVAGFRLGSSPRSRSRKGANSRILNSRGEIRRRRSSIGSERIGSIVAITAILFAPSPRARTDEATNRRPLDPPILVVEPYQGEPDPARVSDRVVISLKDYERLRSWSVEPIEPPSDPLSAASADHEIRRFDHQGPGNDLACLFVSMIELWSETVEATAWRFPIGSARDLSAKVDGRVEPIQIEAGGTTGRVVVRGRGRHVLELSRTVDAEPPIDSRDRGVFIRTPINPIPQSRFVIVEDSHWRLIKPPAAAGAIDPAPADPPGIQGDLGPVGFVETRWEKVNDDKKLRSRNHERIVEGLILWDAEPAGDRLRARLTYRDAAELSVLRIRLEPGTIVRSAVVPGLIDSTIGGSERAPEWIARIEPTNDHATPLTIELDLWRSADSSNSIDAQPIRKRRTPLVEPLEIARFTGAIAFRRPGDWTGRLEPIVATEPIHDEAFVNQWGALPDDLTLAGTSRFNSAPTLEVAAGPIPPRRAVQTEATLRLGSGYVDVDATTVVENDRGISFDADLLIDPRFQIERVQARDLVDWSRDSADRLKLRFDGSIAPRQETKLSGRLAVEVDATATESIPVETRVFWPRWVGARELPGVLTIESPVPFKLDPSPPEIADPAPNPRIYRAVYRINDPGELGVIRRRIEPKSRVQIFSFLSIYPDSARWKARARYQVSAGAIESLRFRLPREWAKSASIRLPGRSHTLTAENQADSTIWTIRPDRPVEGEQDILISADRAFRPGESTTVPKLIPLGRGVAETMIAFADVSGFKIKSDKSLGLSSIESSRFPENDRPEYLPEGTTVTAYEATRDDWSLTIKIPQEEIARRRSSDDDRARVEFADIVGVVAADGSITGSARYDLKPGAAGFLALDPPPRCEFVWASVDQTQTAAAIDSSGRFFIPLVEPDAREVRVVWTGTIPRNSQTIFPIPTLDQSRVLMIMELHAPDTATFRIDSPSFETVSAGTLAAARVERTARRLIERIARIDAASPRERAEVAARLADFDLQMRTAVRSSLATGSATRDANRPQDARRKIADELSTKGIDISSLITDSSNPRSPTEDDSASSPEDALNFSTPSLRLTGPPRCFQGETRSGGADRPILVRLVPRRVRVQAVTVVKIAVSSLLAIGLLTFVLIRFASRSTPRRFAIALTIVALVAGAATVASSPIALFAAFAAAGAGRLAKY